MNNKKTISKKKLNQIEDLLTLIIILNSDYEFHYDDTEDKELNEFEDTLVDFTNSEQGKQYITNFAAATALDNLGIPKSEVIERILSKGKDKQALTDLAETDTELARLVANLLVSAIVPDRTE